MSLSLTARAAAAGACLSVLFLSATAAPVVNDNVDTEHEVLVSSSRLPEGGIRPAASVSIITAEQIAASPAQTVADVLALQAGINIRSLYGNYATRTSVDLRGFGVTGGQNTLILLDGRRLNDVDLSTVEFASFPLSNVERIEIVRGSGSVLYGDGASGGAINIVTRRPKAGELSGLVDVSGGSYSTSSVEGRLSYGGESAAVNLAANGIDSDGYRDNNELQQRNVQLDARFNGAWADVYAKAGLSNQRLGLPGVRTVDPATGLNELVSDPEGATTPNDYGKERTGFLTLGLSHRLGDSAGVLIDAGYRDRKQKALFEAFADYLDTDLTTFSVTPRVYIDHTLLGASGRLLAGIDYYDYDYDSARAFTQQTVGTPIHRLLIDQRSAAVYLSNLSRPAPRLSLDLGARLQRLRLKARDVFNPLAPGAIDKFEFSGAPDFSRSDSESMFEAGLGYEASDAVNLFARASRSVRFATVDELYEFDAFFARTFSPLEPQLARQLEAGARYAQGIVDASLSAYAMELDDEIHFNPVSFANENLDPTRRRGVEAEIGVQATPALSMRANYTLQRATFRDGPFDGNDVPVAPRRMANLSVLWTIVPGLKLATTWHYVGEKRFDNDEADTFASRIPAYDVLDAKLSAEIAQWTLSASAHNLLDEKAYDYGVASTFTPGRFNAYPLPERNFTVGIRRDF